jgi:hypothetical protein
MNTLDFVSESQKCTPGCAEAPQARTSEKRIPININD